MQRAIVDSSFLAATTMDTHGDDKDDDEEEEEEERGCAGFGTKFSLDTTTTSLSLCLTLTLDPSKRGALLSVRTRYPKNKVAPASAKNDSVTRTKLSSNRFKGNTPLRILFLPKKRARSQNRRGLRAVTLWIPKGLKDGRR
jgi:hypothetical protein